MPEENMLSVALPHWQIVVVKPSNGRPMTVVRGPETTTSVTGIPQDAEFLGIEFKLGAFMPAVALDALVNVGRELDVVSASRVVFAGRSWEIPNFDNAFDFVEHLVRDGALVRDPVVQQTLQRQPVAITERSVQRRFLRATGLTYGTVRQIERAERTVDLLSAGVSILDAVDIAGYSDQAHMTRSLQRFVGRTPGQLAVRAR
ncbi:MAG TPA: helix-turn-helix domain-containing protein [Mesorhizobium sp.]|uniref:helix-turn-helix domain-containing protein n=1 Tax=Mesorhizobium sp. TaxID=1871066 RepID=UPI002DDD99BD|nr:helix-turn-helix domain-containing protein [Mesorhizobium sp.]HEV2502600.1 helix-turn-helix domain-containing protein [Mesorhizobium sp.]